MNEPKHTPGPWRIERPLNSTRAHISTAPDADPQWSELASVVVRMNHEDKDCEDGLANARLIAAAPHLLAVVQMAMTMREQQISYFKTRDKNALIASKRLEQEFDNAARAAIKKATL